MVFYVLNRCPPVLDMWRMFRPYSVPVLSSFRILGGFGQGMSGPVVRSLVSLVGMFLLGLWFVNVDQEAQLSRPGWFIV